jgi:ribose 5-phosphate isomerase A
MATTSDPLATLAAHALGFVRAGDVIGLGSGRAAGAFVRALAARVRDGLRVRGVATSEQTARFARELGIELVGLRPDQADRRRRRRGRRPAGSHQGPRERWCEADRGRGVRRQIILVTSGSWSKRSGPAALPVEVMPFAVPFCRRRLETSS